MPKEKNWVVTTSGNRSLAAIEKELTDAGFAVSEVLSAIGCITGSAPDSVAEKMRKIRGVDDVSPEPPPISIGPPDAAIS